VRQRVRARSASANLWNNRREERRDLDETRWAGTHAAASSLVGTPHVVPMSRPAPFGDPGDRFIVATALVHGATLMTADEKIRSMKSLRTLDPKR
jgi:PIN domain nuclease of toxin-antitoxin system